jgi:hypothetical protein
MSIWDDLLPKEGGAIRFTQGFNPGNHRLRGFALKGREITMRLMGGVTREIWSPFSFVSEGQADSSQARSAWVWSLDICRKLGCR